MILVFLRVVLVFLSSEHIKYDAGEVIRDYQHAFVIISMKVMILALLPSSYRLHHNRASRTSIVMQPKYLT